MAQRSVHGSTRITLDLAPFRVLGLTVLSLVILSLAAHDLAAQDLQLSRPSTADQHESSVAVSPTGEGIIVWAENPAPPSQAFDIYARRFDSSGQLLDVEEFLINDFTNGRQFDPQVAVFPSGDFVVAWTGRGGSSTNDYSVWARRFSSQGVAIGSHFQVNEETSTRFDSPDISIAPDQSFLVIWGTFNPQPSEPTLLARRFDSAGQPVAAELVLDDSTSGSLGSRVVHGDDGNFFVVWNRGEHVARLFSSAGAPLSEEFGFGSNASNAQPGAAVSGGTYLATYSVGGSMSLGRARLFDSSGGPIGSAIELGDDAIFRSVTAAAGSPGGFQVVWEAADGGGNGVFRRWISTDGLQQSADMRVNTAIPDSQLRPDISTDATGRFTVSWERGVGINNRDVYGLIHGPAFLPAIFSDGFESGNTDLWDLQSP